MRPVADAVRDLAAATAGLISDIGTLTEAEARGASLLPDWTRGHVLTHLARNAEGGTRLLIWGRTGVPSYEYLSVAARAAAIERGAGRPAAVLVADVDATAAAFADAAAAMPPDAWPNEICWTTGQPDPAENVVRSRLAEVLIHRVDLDLGYGPGSWPAAFVRDMLPVAVDRLAERVLAPLSAQLNASDTGRSFRLVGQDPGPSGQDPEQISGSEADLLAWLLGRSDGASLHCDQSGPLPPVPSIYFT
jgi:maleylpyruvate isomerase